MEYTILDPTVRGCQYTLLVGQAEGEVPYEDYGIRVRRLRDGKTAQRRHLAASPAAIQRMVNALMSAQVEPEELTQALERLR